MGRILKIIAWLVAGFITIFILAAVALYLFFDPNDFREDVATAVYEETGRELTIDGDVSVSLFPWLAVEVGSTSLGDAPGFGDEPIAAFNSASFSVRMMPLLFGQEVVVGAADIDGLRLNLKIDRNGNTNWSDLAPEEGNEEATEATAEGSEVDINRIDLTNASVTYTNAESDERIVLDDLNLSIGRLKSDGSPVPLEAGFRFDVRPATLSGDVKTSTTISYDAGSAVLVLNGFAVDGTIEGLASIPTRMSIATDTVSVDTGASAIEMQPVELELLGMDIDANVEPFTYADRITPKAKVSIAAFSPRSLMTLFDVEPPETADPSALSSVIIDATAQLNTNAIDMTGVTIKLDDTTFTGSLSVPRTDGAYRFDLAGNTLDVSRYMEPAAEGEQDAGGDQVPVEIPADIIGPLKANGKVTLEQATLGAIVFENIEFGLDASGGRMRMHPISSGLFGGSYNGDVRIDVSGSVPALSVNERIEGVDMAKLARAMFEQENVTGTIDGAFRLAGRGADMAAVQRDLDGNMSFELKDGAYEGTDLWYELRRARALLKQEEPPQPTLPARTEFSTVTVTGTVTDGIMRSDDLFAQLPAMRLTGAGTVNLAEGTVDYGLTARVLSKPEFLPDATPEELDEFTEAVIPMKITGPLSSPSIQPDLEKLLRQRVEDEIKDRLKDKLGDLFK